MFGLRNWFLENDSEPQCKYKLDKKKLNGGIFEQFSLVYIFIIVGRMLPTLGYTTAFVIGREKYIKKTCCLISLDEQ